jgi:hypothetical protein
MSDTGEKYPNPNAPAAPDYMLKLFAYVHLPDRLKRVSEPFAQLAHDIAASVPPGPERTVCLRKLLEAKDACVRAVVFAEDQT